MALIKAQAAIHCWSHSLKCLPESLPCTANGLFQALKESYDWTNGCRKIAIVLNPSMVFIDNSYAKKLREEDVKGVGGCFLLLSWVLLLIGRMSAIAVLYTTLLTGIVLQYAMLQRCDEQEAKESSSTPSDKDCSARNAMKEEHQESGRVKESECSAAAQRWSSPGLATVASALAFCCVPLAACALVTQLLGNGQSHASLAPLPAAWCTLLATCSLLPRATRGAQRVLVILPCGVLFTILALLFLG